MKTKWIVLMLLPFLAACEKSINITTPIILINNTSLYVQEEIEIKVEEYISVDRKRINVDYYNWSIENSNEHIIIDDFNDTSTIYWTPVDPGYFRVKVVIGYDQNKSITVLKEILIENKTITITTPKILFDNSTLFVFNEIEMRVEEYATFNGDTIYPKHFEWIIETFEGVVIKDDFNDSSFIRWTPKEADYFIVKVKIIYDTNNSISTLKELTIEETATSLQYKMAGYWSGHAVRYNGREWDLQLEIDSSGYCSGEVTSEIPEQLPCLGIWFYVGTQYWTDEGIGIGCDGNTNCPCQRILVEDAENDIGDGKIWVGYGHKHGDDPIEWSCTDHLYYVADISLNETSSELHFKLKCFEHLHEVIEYDLIRN